MLASTIYGLAAVTALTSATPLHPTIVARKPPTTTGMGIGEPTSVEMRFTNYYASGNCDGNNVTGTYRSGECIKLAVPARSWRTSADVNTQQMFLAVYENDHCGTPGVLEHLDAGSACMTMDGVTGTTSNATARSFMINV